MNLSRPVGRKRAKPPARADDRVDHSPKHTGANLILPRSPLIGRRHEIATVQACVLQDETGLLTLTGPGGIGKTRLAMQVAANLLDHFVDGVYFVSLAPIRDPDLVGLAIAEVLGLAEAGGRPMLEILQAYLAQRQMLLVLDNFEQVVAAAPLVSALLAACPHVKILVTSRTPLHLYGEQEYPVPPLELPNAKHLPSGGEERVSALAQVAAVALFVRRAQAVQPHFALSQANAAAVTDICIGLDGLPLAIELAAARIKLFSPPALLARLQQRLTLLTGGAHDLPERQRTLRDEIAWSYDLLAADEQKLFRRLAVFSGGFTLPAAHAIGTLEGDDEVAVLEGITTLLDQNLVRQADGAGGEARFGMLETIREYGLEQLAASGEGETVRRHHARFFLALAEAIDTSVLETNEATGFAQLAVEHANWRVALEWSQMRANETEIALRLVEALRSFWMLNGYWSEGRHWFEAALARTTIAEHTTVRAQMLVGAGRMATMQGDHPTARGWLEQGMTLAQELGMQQLIAQALTYLSFIAQAQHDGALAYTQLQQALVIGRELGDKVRIAESLLFLGALARDQHDYMGAQALYEESLALFQELETPFGVADALSFLGQVAQYQSDYQRARTLYRNSLAGLQALGLFQWQAVALCLEGLAGICVVQVQFEEAARLFGAAAALQEVLRGSPSPSSYPPEDKHKDLAAHLGEEAFAAAWAAGHALSAEQAIDYALALPAPIVSAAIQPRAYPTGLTEREVEVLRLLAQGLTYVQIAETLVISRRTVNAHVISIYSKLGVNTRFAAARFAADHHLI